MTDVREVLSGKSHRDENFPVASWIIAPQHRAIIMAFYRFVRAADDVADHPTLDASEKHRLLDHLEAALAGQAQDPEAEPLRRALAERGLTARHPLDILTAFRRDVDQNRCADWDALIDYCAVSAMPVGRFVLDVHGESRSLWPGNDALCAALQIINHVQDCGKDFRLIGRVYLPADMMDRHGAQVAEIGLDRATPALRGVLVEVMQRTTLLLDQSAGFAPRIRDWRLGLEVAAIQGLAVSLAAGLMTRDPLSENVHMGRAASMMTALGAMLRHGIRRLATPRHDSVTPDANR